MTRSGRPVQHAASAAVQLNVGPLVVPHHARAVQQQRPRAYPLPPKLFSHNDQQSVWQSRRPKARRSAGAATSATWRCRSNGNSLFTCISAAGNAVFLSGDNALQYQVSPAARCASTRVNEQRLRLGRGQARRWRTLVQQSRAATCWRTNTTRSPRARSVPRRRSTARWPASPWPPTFPAGNPLADQLKMVARLIGGAQRAGREAPGVLRVAGRLRPARQPDRAAPGLMAQRQRRDRRVLRGHAGARRGRQGHRVHRVRLRPHACIQRRRLGPRLGQPPLRGRRRGQGPGVLRHAAAGQHRQHGALQKTSGTSARAACCRARRSTQYAATLARWFGVADSELGGILPNIGNFGAPGQADYPRDLGFMA